MSPFSISSLEMKWSPGRDNFKQTQLVLFSFLVGPFKRSEVWVTMSEGRQWMGKLAVRRLVQGNLPANPCIWSSLPWAECQERGTWNTHKLMVFPSSSKDQRAFKFGFCYEDMETYSCHHSHLLIPSIHRETFQLAQNTTKGGLKDIKCSMHGKKSKRQVYQ